MVENPTDPAEVRARECLAKHLPQTRQTATAVVLRDPELYGLTLDQILISAGDAIRAMLAFAEPAAAMPGLSGNFRGWSELVDAASAHADFVAAREAMNAARPVDQINATPAEYALYDERYKADHAAERQHFRTALKLAQVAEHIVAALVETEPQDGGGASRTAIKDMVPSADAETPIGPSQAHDSSGDPRSVRASNGDRTTGAGVDEPGSAPSQEGQGPEEGLAAPSHSGETGEVELREAIDKALGHISGGLCYFSAHAKHAQLLDAQRTLEAALKASPDDGGLS